MIWYFHIEGTCRGNEAIATPFGFFVHVLVSAENIREGQRAVFECMADQDLRPETVHCKGLYHELLWDDCRLERKLSGLAERAAGCELSPVFSEFQSWKLD